MQYPRGDVRFYGAKVGTTKDNTQAFNDAIQDKAVAFCNEPGKSVTEGGIVVNGGKSLSVNPELTLQREDGVSGEPIIQVYGTRSRFNSNGCTVRNMRTRSPQAIILLGPDVNEVEGGPTDRPCHGIGIYGGVKVAGAVKRIEQDGSPGILVHSIARKRFAKIHTTYSWTIDGADIVNCDVGLETSTDANRGNARNVTITQWKACAAKLNASYGNRLNLKLEKPLPVSNVWRYAILFGSHEADTSPNYPITQALGNILNLYAELPNSSGNIVSLFTFDPVTRYGGRNWMGGTLENLMAGFGTDGRTTRAAVGTNIIDCPTLYVDYYRKHKPSSFARLFNRR